MLKTSASTDPVTITTQIIVGYEETNDGGSQSSHSDRKYLYNFY